LQINAPSEAPRAAYDQQRFIADPETDRLRDLRGFDTEHLRRRLNSRRAVISLNEFDARRGRFEEDANRFKAHWLFPHIRLDLRSKRTCMLRPVELGSGREPVIQYFDR
jgi:hypothetical protein